MQLSVLVCALLTALSATAQVYTEPPLLIQIVRARQGPYHDAAKTPVNVFALSALGGPQERWFLETHNSFASIEETNEALLRVGGFNHMDSREPLGVELLGESRSLVAIYRPTLSYRPDQAIRQFARARYYYVSVHRVRSGTTSAFAEMLRSRKDGLDDMNVDRPELTYQVVAGGPSGVYIILAPLASLQVLDDGLAKRAYQAEPGSGGREGDKVAQSEIVRGHLIFRVDPGLSHVTDDFAAQWIGFWRGR